MNKFTWTWLFFYSYTCIQRMHAHEKLQSNFEVERESFGLIAHEKLQSNFEVERESFGLNAHEKL